MRPHRVVKWAFLINESLFNQNFGGMVDFDRVVRVQTHLSNHVVSMQWRTVLKMHGKLPDFTRHHVLDSVFVCPVQLSELKLLIWQCFIEAVRGFQIEET